MNLQLVLGFVDPHAERLKRAHRVETVLSSAIASQRADTLGQRIKNQRAVGNGFVSGNRYRPVQRPSGCDRQGRQLLPASTEPTVAAASRPDRKFVSFHFGPFQHFLNARRVPRLNQLSQFTQRSLIGTNAGDDILPIPEKNVPPHLR